MDCLIKIVIAFKYLRSKKSGITNSINHNFGKIRSDSYNSLSIKKILTFHNAIILIKSVVNKNKNKYYYKKVCLKINECLHIINAIL